MSLNTEFTATGIRHTNYVDSLLAHRQTDRGYFRHRHTSYVDCLLAESQRN
jgi:hypothetical protein